jgi:hypothetical protein
VDLKMAAAAILLKTETRFGVAAALRRWFGRKDPMSEREVEEARAGVDFILEMMQSHPEAFASDEAFRYSALYASGRF